MGDCKHDKCGDIRRYNVAVVVTDGRGERRTLAVRVAREPVARTLRFTFEDGHPGSLSRHEVQRAIQAAYAHLRDCLVGLWVAEDAEYASLAAPRNDDEMAASIAMVEREMERFSTTTYRKGEGAVGRPRMLHMGPRRGPSNRHKESNRDD